MRTLRTLPYLKALSGLFASIFLALLAIPGITSVSFAKEAPPSPYQGVVLQVDTSNPADTSFSLLDRRGISTTFHITSATRFTKRQSLAQLQANMLASVNAQPATTGILNATRLHFSAGKQAPLAIQGILVSTDTDSNAVTLSLNDATTITISLTKSKVATLQPGVMLALNANISSSGSLSASTYRVVSSKTSYFKARGIVSHINTRLHLVTLVSPSGNSFSLRQQNLAAFSIGEKVNVTANSDSQGNLTIQSVSIDNANSHILSVIGLVNSIDTSGGSFSLIDKEGNSNTISASATLLSTLQIGSFYHVSLSIGSDGSLSAIKITPRKHHTGNAHKLDSH